MLKISWKDQATNASVLEKVGKKDATHVKYERATKTQMVGACV